MYQKESYYMISGESLEEIKSKAIVLDRAVQLIENYGHESIARTIAAYVLDINAIIELDTYKSNVMPLPINRDTIATISDTPTIINGVKKSNCWAINNSVEVQDLHNLAGQGTGDGTLQCGGSSPQKSSEHKDSKEVRECLI